MRRQRTIRLLICAAMAGSATVAAAAIPGAIASAVPLTVSCTTLTATSASSAALTSTGTAGGCTGTGATSANAGTPPAHGTVVETRPTPTSLSGTATITWSNGKKTASSFKYAVVTNNCATAPAGYAKFLKVHSTGAVLKTGTTTLGMVGGATSGYVCVYKKTVGGSILAKNMGPTVI